MGGTSSKASAADMEELINSNATQSKGRIHRPGSGVMTSVVKIEAPGYGPRVLVIDSISQGARKG